MIFFIERTTLCNKKKLYKLLFLFDFEHFEQTGRNVTGFDYFAWRMGPVPTVLHEAIEFNKDSFEAYLGVETSKDKRGFTTVSFEIRQPFEPKYFTRRELRLLNDLADRFEMMSGDDMEAFTHRQGTPWYQVWEVEQREQGQIPYEYALNHLDPNKKDIILDIARDRETFIENYR